MGNAKVIPKSQKFFLPSQVRWIRDTSSFKILEKGRQLGASLATSFSVVERTAPSGVMLDSWIVSRDELAAKLFLKDCKKFSELLNVVCNDVNSSIIEVDKKPSSFAVRYLNERTITCLSSNVNALASKRGNVIIDEYSLHNDQEELLAIAKPVTTWNGGQIELISTHRGYNTTFNQLIREIKDGGNPKGISLHSYSLEDALNEGLLYKIQSKLPNDHEIQAMDEMEYFNHIRNQCINESIFGREYMLVPDTDELNFFPSELVSSCQDGLIKDGPVYIGIDFGRTNDLTVVWVLNKHNNHYYTREVKTLVKTEFSEQERIITSIIEKYSPISVGCDNRGIGMHITENLKKKFKQVQALNSTAQSKESNAYCVKQKLEDKTLHLPLDKNIISDFSNIQKIVTVNSVRFDSRRNESGHGDRYSALAIAMEVVESKKPFFFMPSTT